MPRSLTPLARTLRREASGAERRLWQGLRRKQVGGFRFRRQAHSRRLHRRFGCFEARMVVEVDGRDRIRRHADDGPPRRALGCARRRRVRSVPRFTNDVVRSESWTGWSTRLAGGCTELRRRSQDESFIPESGDDGSLHKRGRGGVSPRGDWPEPKPSTPQAPKSRPTLFGGRKTHLQREP